MVQSNILTTGAMILALGAYAQNNAFSSTPSTDNSVDTQYRAVEPADMQYFSSSDCPKDVASSLRAANVERTTFQSITCQAINFCEILEDERYNQIYFSIPPEMCEYEIIAAETAYQTTKMQYILDAIHESLRQGEYSNTKWFMDAFEAALNDLNRPEKIMSFQTQKSIHPKDDPQDVLFQVAASRQRFENQYRDIFVYLSDAVTDIVKEESCRENIESLDTLLNIGERISHRACLPEAFMSLVEKTIGCIEKEPEEIQALTEEKKKTLQELAKQIYFFQLSDALYNDFWCDVSEKNYEEE